METERERLNLRISDLTQQLADAKLANNMEALTVRFGFSITPGACNRAGSHWEPHDTQLNLNYP